MVVSQRYKLSLAGFLLFSLPVFAATGSKNPPPKKHGHAASRPASAHKTRLSHATRAHEATPAVMPAQRAAQIQTALIQKGYMTGTPTGTWDAQTVSAMQKLQGDNGWQTKITPDSRALIKLGLGPTADAAAPTQDMAQETPR